MSFDLLYEIVRRKRSFTMLVWFKERERIQGARKNFNPCLRITANLDRDHRIDVFASKASPSLRNLSTRESQNFIKREKSIVPMKHIRETQNDLSRFPIVRATSFSVVYFSRRLTPIAAGRSSELVFLLWYRLYCDHSPFADLKYLWATLYNKKYAL